VRQTCPDAPTTAAGAAEGTAIVTERTRREFHS
jgi:hypothetical protein